MEEIIKKAFEYAIEKRIIEKGTFLEIKKSEECDYEGAFRIKTDYITYTNYTPNDKSEVYGEWEIHTKDSLKTYIKDRIDESIVTIFFIQHQWEYFEAKNAEAKCRKVLRSGNFGELGDKFINSFNIDKLLEDGDKFTQAFGGVGFKYNEYYLFKES
jgi:hypothetical protein